MKTLYRLFSAMLLALLTLSMFVGSVGAATEGPSFGIRPVRHDPKRPATQSYFIYEAGAGLRIEDEVLVRNNGTQAGTVRLYAVDSTTGQTGGAVYADETASHRGVSNWIQLSQQELQLGPGEEQRVPFTLTVPADASAGQHLGGFVAEDATIKAGGSGAVQLKFQTRVVTAVQVNLPGPVVEKVSITGVASGGEHANQRLFLSLRNDGNQMVKPTGTLTVTDAQGQEVQRQTLSMDLFLPQTEIEYPVLVQQKALAAGKYRTAVELRYGTGGTASYQGEFTVTAEQIAQVFQSTAPLAPPPVAATGATAAPATTNGTAQPQWPLFAGGAVLLVLAVVGGILLGRRGRVVDAAK